MSGGVTSFAEHLYQLLYKPLNTKNHELLNNYKY